MENPEKWETTEIGDNRVNLVLLGYVDLMVNQEQKEKLE